MIRRSDGRIEIVLSGRAAALLFAGVLTLGLLAAGLRQAAAEDDCPDKHCISAPGVKMQATLDNTPTPTIAVTPWVDPACGTPPEPVEGVQAWVAPGSYWTYNICMRLFVNSRPVTGLPWQFILHRDQADDVSNNVGQMQGVSGMPWVIRYQTGGYPMPPTGDVVVTYLGTTYRTTVSLPSLPPTPIPTPETPVPTP